MICIAEEMNIVQDLFVFFRTTLDSTSSSNMTLTSCRQPRGGSEPRSASLSYQPRCRTKIQLLIPANYAKPPPGERQCRNLNMYLSKFQPPTQMKNYATPARPLQT